MNTRIFQEITLDAKHSIYPSHIIPQLDLNEAEFQAIWDLHPEAYHKIKIHGKEVQTPRWQQAFGKSYRYTGSSNIALPITEKLALFMDWSKREIDERLNGLLLNWYDGEQGHYIGAHRDDIRDLCTDSPIITISLGQKRIFRMRPYKGKGFVDIEMRHGCAIVIPWETNLAWTHEVPHFKKYQNRRISITLRAYR